MPEPGPVQPNVGANRSGMRVVILMPLRDDWVSAAELIRRLDLALDRYPASFQILVVDDASVERPDPKTFAASYSALGGIRVLRLRRNLGHQRAIAIGLAHLEDTTPCDAVLVMDADGEDTPEGVVQLLHAFAANRGSTAIFAERSRRSESLLFQIFYKLYKIAHRCLTGLSVRVGNFSILPAGYLTTLSVVSETWNHYAAAVFRSRLSFTMVPIPRGNRIAGSSSMNIVSLIGHGLSAISVFGDVVGVRMMVGCMVGSFLAGMGILAVIATRLFTTQAIPGWATYTAGALVIILIQLIAIAASFTFYILSSRSNVGFIPCRDYGLFVAEISDLYPHD
jgi:polyisoprenyl-phosphate glycosyltransferase